MEFLPLYSYPNPFHGADQDAGLANFWIVKQAIQWEKFGYTPGKFKIWSPMIWDRWFNEPMDGDRWEVLKEEKCWIWWEIYLSDPKSTLQIWLSKNEDWLALTTPSQDDEWGNGYVFGEFCQQNIGFIGVTISPWWFPVIRSWLCLYSPSAGPCSTCGEWPSARLDAWGFGMKNMKKWKKTDGFAMFRQEKGGCTICFCVLVDQRCGCWHQTCGIQQWELGFV